jgi:hypothetical protein
MDRTGSERNRLWPNLGQYSGTCQMGQRTNEDCALPRSMDWNRILCTIYTCLLRQMSLHTLMTSCLQDSLLSRRSPRKVLCCCLVPETLRAHAFRRNVSSVSCRMRLQRPEDVETSALRAALPLTLDGRARGTRRALSCCF